MFGGGSIEKGMFDFIRKILPDGKTILEFGSGWTTSQFLKYYNVISIEHDREYATKQGNNHKLYLAELKDGWYDPAIVAEALRNQYDLILVDGPPNIGRTGLIKNLLLFNGAKCNILFDDVNRDRDRQAMEAFCKKHGYSYKIFPGGEKDFAYCVQTRETVRKCIYTVITGEYDQLLIPANIPIDFDLICFTDNKELKSDVWHIIYVEPQDNRVKHHRQIKILSHKFLPDYGLTIYIDGNMILKQDISNILEFYNGGFMTKKHPVRRNIYQEAEVIIKRQKARKRDVDVQMARYRGMGFNDEALYETGVIIRDHSEHVIKLNEAWWEELKEFTHRDQLSLPFAAKITGVPVNSFGKTLFERFIKIVPHTGKKTAITYVWHSTPADSGKNIGRAYNEFCGIVPNDEDWICLRDGDSMFILSDWQEQIEAALELHGDKYQLFGCVTNRLSTTNQRPFPEDFNDPSVLKAKERAVFCHDNKYTVVTPHDKPVAGLFMLFQKKTWKKNPFNENTISADTDFGYAILNNGGKIGLMQGLYLFHYYRFHHPNPTQYKKHLLPG